MSKRPTTVWKNSCTANNGKWRNKNGLLTEVAVISAQAKAINGLMSMMMQLLPAAKWNTHLQNMPKSVMDGIGEQQLSSVIEKYINEMVSVLVHKGPWTCYMGSVRR